MIFLALLKKAWAYILPRLNFHRVAYLVLGLSIVGFLFYTRMLEKELQTAQDQHYVLPPGVTNQVTVKDRIVTVIKKVKGDTIIERVYVPVEGGATVVVSTSTGKPEVTVTFKTKGFCFRPGLSVLYDHDVLTAGLDAKMAYWSRLSAGSSLTLRSTNLWVSYHLDQLPYWHPQNLEGFVGRSILRFDGRPNNWQIGLRLNF